MRLRRTPPTKIRFGRVPPRLRHHAEAFLNRKLNEYLQLHGTYPSRQKMASMIANASWYALYVVTGKSWSWSMRARRIKETLTRLDRKRARTGTPADPLLPPKPRSRWALGDI
jgi:hypothetical protein